MNQQTEALLAYFDAALANTEKTVKAGCALEQIGLSIANMHRNIPDFRAAGEARKSYLKGLDLSIASLQELRDKVAAPPIPKEKTNER